ncbi:DNA-processing protein DprA [Amycolatopsis sp. CA-230715]|uniref:DNA-processing protein DprA n=1 Tax=Amycolatopsis sp. CA-230715 TaxID=2745196 RepID=UPI001C0391B8|nr:DNA-processing protein DprA [Amycolatopsis sp. CA-230715]
MPDAVRAERTSLPSASLLEAAQRDLAGALDGPRLVIPEDDEEWPFAQQDSPREPHTFVENTVYPLALWVHGTGSLRDLANRSVALIGSRAASSYGEHIASEFGYGLATAGMVIVNSASYGVAGAALRGALSADHPALVVQFNGLDVSYPAGHTRLLSHVRDNGLVVSEYPAGTVPSRTRKLASSRVLAQLASYGAVVVEASLRSETLRIADLVHQAGRTVFAVPGPITSSTSSGSHRLIQHGARLVTELGDVLRYSGGPERSTTS